MIENKSSYLDTSYLNKQLKRKVTLNDLSPTTPSMYINQQSDLKELVKTLLEKFLLCKSKFNNLNQEDLNSVFFWLTKKVHIPNLQLARLLYQCMLESNPPEEAFILFNIIMQGVNSGVAKRKELALRMLSEGIVDTSCQPHVDKFLRMAISDQDRSVRVTVISNIICQFIRIYNRKIIEPIKMFPVQTEFILKNQREALQLKMVCMCMLKYHDNMGYKQLLTMLINFVTNTDILCNLDIPLQLAIAQLFNQLNELSLENEPVNGLPRIVKSFVAVLAQFNHTIINLEIIKFQISKYQIFDERDFKLQKNIVSSIVAKGQLGIKSFLRVARNFIRNNQGQEVQIIFNLNQFPIVEIFKPSNQREVISILNQIRMEYQIEQINSLVTIIEKQSSLHSEPLTDQIITLTSDQLIRQKNAIDTDIKVRICNIFIKQFENDQNESQTSNSNLQKEGNMPVESKSLEVESVLSVFNLVKELNVKEFQFKLMTLLETHLQSFNEHILDSIFTKIYIESLVQCWNIAADKTKPSLHAFIASLINKLLFQSDAFKNIVIDSLIQLKQIKEMNELIDSLLEKIIANEKDAHLTSQINAKLNMKQELDLNIANQVIDIDLLDELLEAEDLDLENCDLGQKYEDALVAKTNLQTSKDKKTTGQFNKEIGGIEASQAQNKTAYSGSNSSSNNKYLLNMPNQQESINFNARKLSMQKIKDEKMESNEISFDLNYKVQINKGESINCLINLDISNIFDENILNLEVTKLLMASDENEVIIDDQSAVRIAFIQPGERETLQILFSNESLYTCRQNIHIKYQISASNDWEDGIEEEQTISLEIGFNDLIINFNQSLLTEIGEMYLKNLDKVEPYAFEMDYDNQEESERRMQNKMSKMTLAGKSDGYKVYLFAHKIYQNTETPMDLSKKFSTVLSLVFIKFKTEKGDKTIEIVIQSSENGIVKSILESQLEAD